MKNIFAGKVSTVVVTSTDNIIISVMTDIVMVGLYSNYSMIIGYIQTFLSQFTSATQASLGNMFALENKSYSNEILRKLSVIEYFATSFCTTIIRKHSLNCSLTDKLTPLVFCIIDMLNSNDTEH